MSTQANDAFAAAVNRDGVEVVGIPEEAPKETPVSEDEVLDLDEGDEVVAADEGEETPEEDKPKKKEKTAKERIQELVQKNRALERERDIEREVNRRLQSGDEIKLRNDATSGNLEDARVAPDPTDQSKYPLGALDDRFIEDLTDWKVDQKFRAAQQRQLENDAKAEAARIEQDNLKKAMDIVDRGESLYDDFREVVWEAGRRGDLKLSEVAFHAITAVEHGDEVVYALGKNLAEAERVFRLSPSDQIKYVTEQNAKFAAKKVARKVPQAGDPPSHQARGASGRYTVDYNSTDTDLGEVARALFNHK